MDVMLTVAGVPFRCECKCNVFHKGDDDDSVYICNACGVAWKGGAA